MTVALPSRMTEKGAVARLLMAEAMDPSNPSYVETASLKSMQWMKVVLENRLSHNPAQFLAPHAKTLTDIIKAPGQFAGFQHYPNYSTELVNRLQSMIDIANRPKDPRGVAYTIFIRNCLSVTSAPPISDPSLADDPKSLGLAAWRSSGAAPPGGKFSKYRDLAGNTFYKLLP
jgi:hypothetical protein